MSTALSATQQIPLPQPPQNPTESCAQVPDWKQQLAQRMDAYRAKHPESAPVSPACKRNIANGSRASSIARAVASRYAAAPTYSELLLAAAEAQKAAEEAQAELAARAAFDAQVEFEKRAEMARQEQESASESSGNFQSDPALPMFTLAASTIQRETAQSEGEQAFAVRYGSPLRTLSGKAVMPHFAERTKEMRLHQPAREQEPSLEELLASSVVEPRAFLPSKLIEFPRELVSVHRARPRLPEPKECEPMSALQEQGPSQLRIFEVQPEPGSAIQAGPENIVSKEPTQAISEPIPEPRTESLPNPRKSNFPSAAPMNDVGDASRRSSGPASTTPPTLNPGTNRAHNNAPKPVAKVADTGEAAPGVRAFKGLEWAAISLDKETASYSRRAQVSVSDYMPFMVEPASIDRRLMAFAVDFAVVTAGFLGFLVVFVASTPHLPTGLTAVALAGAVYGALWVLYQMLFFSLSGATAGMLYARIALCTFDDKNPSRKALRGRLAAWWLSCLPLGMGFLWSFVDEDNLCWHDRMTRMYQRSY